jgi:hypothetical protein
MGRTDREEGMTKRYVCMSKGSRRGEEVASDIPRSTISLSNKEGEKAREGGRESWPHGEGAKHGRLDHEARQKATAIREFQDAKIKGNSFPTRTISKQKKLLPHN